MTSFDQGLRIKIALVLAALLIAGTIFVTVNNAMNSQNQSASETEKEMPVPPPAPGERFTDLAEDDFESRSAFIEVAADQFNIVDDEFKNPEAITQECIANGNAIIHNRIRNDENYANDHSRIDADFFTLNENCHEKYAEFPYVPPSTRVLAEDHNDHGK